MGVSLPISDSRSWKEIAAAYVQAINWIERFNVSGPLGYPARKIVRSRVRGNPSRWGVLAGFDEGAAGRAQLYLPRSDRCKGPRVLLSNPRLHAGGAPKLIVEIAQILIELGYDPLIIAESDGLVRAQCERDGIPLVIHPERATPGHSAMLYFGNYADLIIANTVVAWQAIEQFAERKPTIWYSHEISILEEIRRVHPGIDELFAKASLVWAGSALAATAVRHFRNDVEVVPYGLEPIECTANVAGSRDPLRFSFYATIEHRKGQDLAVQAVSLLRAEERALFNLHFHGRVLQPDYDARVRDLAKATPNVTIGEEIAEDEYRSALAASDAILLTSRDDTLPLVSLDALSAGRVLMCTPTVGTAAYITNGVNGFVSDATSAASIAAMISSALEQRDEWPRIGEAARALFHEHFSRRRFADKLKHTIASLLPADKRPAR